MGRLERHVAFLDYYHTWYIDPKTIYELNMITPGEYIFSALAITFLCALFSRTLAIGFFFSLGMIMILSAWLEIINFDGSWPKDQPRTELYKASPQKVTKLYSLTGDPMSSSDWEDFRRCLNVNVCVRKFKGLRE